MLPINRVLNCQRVLSSGKYQLTSFGNQYKASEDLWLIKYLILQGKSKREIAEIIRPIHEAEYGYMSYRLYSSRYDCAKSISLKKYSKKIEIYESEMDALNHLCVPMLQKKFVLCVIVI